jgi:hypothetical protein
MAILCLGDRSLHLDGYGFIGELALDGSIDGTAYFPFERPTPHPTGSTS